METILGWLATTGMSLASVILKAVIILVIGILVIRSVMKILTTILEKSKMEKAAHSLILTLAKTVMFVLLGLIIASSIGIDVTGIVALASVVTLAVSLSLQNMLANVVGGFTLLYTHPFRSGDYVEIAGQAGTVSEIGMTYTKLVTPDNKLTYIPNSAVVSAEIVNYTVMGTRRLTVAVSASYDSPVPTVLEALMSCADGAYVLQDPAPQAVLVSYGDSVINYELRIWLKGDDYWPANFEINERLSVAFAKYSVEMSYNHINVHLDK